MNRYLYNRVVPFLVGLLIIILPIHNLIIYHLIGDVLPSAKFWKEFVLLLLIVLATINAIYNRQYDLQDFLIHAFILLLTILVLTDFKIHAAYGFRNLAEPLLFLWSIKQFRISEQRYHKFLKMAVFIALIISVYGIFQALVLKETFLAKLINNGARLHHSFFVSGGSIQRNTGTFSAPNTFGLYLAVIISLMEHYKHSIFQSKTWRYALYILILSLLLTFSRSAILGVAVTFIIFHQQRVLRGVMLGLVVLILIPVVAPNVFSTLTNFIEYNISGTDPSIGGHMDSIHEATALMKDHWLFGMGIGLVGPRAVLYTQEFIDIESSVAALILECGILGFLIYSGIFILASKKLVNFKMLLAMLPALFLLPGIYETETISVIFVLFGLALGHGKSIQSLREVNPKEKTSNIPDIQ